MNLSHDGFSFHDILLLIGAERKSGELVIESGNNIGSLLFHEGEIMLAFSPYTRALGDLLVEQGVLDESELLDILKQQMAGPPTPVGTLLLKTGKVSFQVIESIVHDQIRSSVNEFATWNPMRTTFQKKDIKPFDSIRLSVREFLPGDMLKSVRTFTESLTD